MTSRFTAADFARDAVGHGTHAIDTAGYVHGFTPAIRDALIERGILYQDADHVWRFTTADFPDLAPEARMGYLAVCDFCSARPAPWTIPCESFTLPPIGAGMPEAWSEGDWAACDRCGEAIAEGRRASFLAHCVQAHQQLAAGYPRELRQALKQTQARLHARFWQHYRGGAHRGKVRVAGH